MMQIPLDKEKKLLLLKWLKQGYVDNLELSKLERENPMTLEEMYAEIDRLTQIDRLEEQNKDLPLAE